MTIGEKILNLRKARGWSQEELAERIGVTRQAVSRWESGTAKPDADKIIGLCCLFEISADYLLLDKAPAETLGATSWFGWFWKLTKRQRQGVIILGISLLLCLVLVILSGIYPVDYMLIQGDGTEIHLVGVAAYVVSNGLQWLVLLILLGFGVGVVDVFGETVAEFLRGDDQRK